MTFGDRMKCYEENTKLILLRRTPTIIRIDGKAFHTWTKKAKLERPYDSTFHNTMDNVTYTLCEEIQNAVFGYTQSDEISILLNDWTNLDTEQWFGGSVQKIASVSASLATAVFNGMYHERTPHIALFDARVHQVPFAEVANYFIWRQKDAIRNSINMLARSHFSQKQLHGKNTDQVREMLRECGHPWEDRSIREQRGFVVYSGEYSFVPDPNIPLFTEDRSYIEGHL